MNNSDQTNPSEKRNSNAPFFVLLAITGLPFILALYFIFNPELVAHLSTGNKGALVQPPVKVPPMQMNTLNGKSFNTRQLKGNWTLLTVAASECDQKCIQNLYFMRQIRLAMGEERSRVQRIFLLSDTDQLKSLANKLEQYQGTITITGSEENRNNFTELLQVDETPLANRIFMIDPQGHLMMAYPANPPWKDVLKDLQHLINIVQM